MAQNITPNQPGNEVHAPGTAAATPTVASLPAGTPTGAASRTAIAALKAAS